MAGPGHTSPTHTGIKDHHYTVAPSEDALLNQGAVLEPYSKDDHGNLVHQIQDDIEELTDGKAEIGTTLGGRKLTEPDGYFGDRTMNAIRDLASKNNLQIDPSKGITATDFKALHDLAEKHRHPAPEPKPEQVQVTSLADPYKPAVNNAAGPAENPADHLTDHSVVTQNQTKTRDDGTKIQDVTVASTGQGVLETDHMHLKEHPDGTGKVKTSQDITLSQTIDPTDGVARIVTTSERTVTDNGESGHGERAVYGTDGSQIDDLRFKEKKVHGQPGTEQIDVYERRHGFFNRLFHGNKHIASLKVQNPDGQQHPELVAAQSGDPQPLYEPPTTPNGNSYGDLKTQLAQGYVNDIEGGLKSKGYTVEQTDSQQTKTTQTGAKAMGTPTKTVAKLGATL